MEQIVRWYDRETWPYVSDRERLKHYANWLNQIPWDFFCTLTFAWRVSDRQAQNIFHKFIDRLEIMLRCTVTYVRGDEKRLSGAFKSACPRHFHALLACPAQVTPRYIADLWMAMAGNRSDGTGAVVEPYDATRKGVEYALKFVNADGNWDCKNLDLYLPTEGTNGSNHANRRRLQRHTARQQRLASALVARELSNR